MLGLDAVRAELVKSAMLLLGTGGNGSPQLGEPNRRNTPLVTSRCSTWAFRYSNISSVDRWPLGKFDY